LVDFFVFFDRFWFLFWGGLLLHVVFEICFVGSEVFFFFF